MTLENVRENLEDIQENTQAYIESSLAYYKLWGFKVAMKSTTLALKFFLIAICLMIGLLFISVAGALAIGKLLDSYTLGFLIVAGIYLILAFLLFLIKGMLISNKFQPQLKILTYN